MKYANIILPLAVESAFTYKVPEALEGRLRVGNRVIVPLGPRKFYTGIVESFSFSKPSGFEAKEIIDMPSGEDEIPTLRHPQLKFWDWMSQYYLCTPGDVMHAALPAQLKLESESVIALSEDYIERIGSLELTERELKITGYLKEKGKTPAKSLQKEMSGDISTVIAKLASKGMIEIAERITERYKKRKVEELVMLVDLSDSRAVADSVKSLSRSERNQRAFMALAGLFKKKNPGMTISREEVMATMPEDIEWPVIKTLAAKKLVNITVREVSEFTYNGLTDHKLPELSEAQQEALMKVEESFKDKSVTLLRGITASGKTEIYIHLIDRILHSRQQVLYLVPEIALTTQLTDRLQKVFGERVVIYHSKFSDRERARTWLRLASTNEPLVVIGARSAVFLPFAKLGLVIVDEEHEPSYKQAEPAPRYNGRDAAIMLASLHGTKTLLGSATPSIETYYKATTGKFGLVELLERYSKVELPEIEIIDMKREQEKNARTGIFADKTLKMVHEAVDNSAQAILFINRRGYSPKAVCKMCAHLAKCDFCDVALTYHRTTDRLVCHYCGTSYPLPKTCPNCGEPAMMIRGYGTERVEEELNNAFDNKQILRMDLDTTRNKQDYSSIISTFSKGKASILVGTQMVTKGLDFDNVSVVGVVNADAQIHQPDFRAGERAFNMLCQVAGRAGRREKKGTVAIQAYQTDHPVLEFVKAHDYTGFYEYELQERHKFAYPPFTRVIMVNLKHRDEQKLIEAANKYATRLYELFGNRVKGPTVPSVGRIQSFHIRTLMLKLELAASPAKVKEILRQVYIEIMSTSLDKGLSVYYDVDPG